MVRFDARAAAEDPRAVPRAVPRACRIRGAACAVSHVRCRVTRYVASCCVGLERRAQRALGARVGVADLFFFCSFKSRTRHRALMLLLLLLLLLIGPFFPVNRQFLKEPDENSGM